MPRTVLSSLISSTTKQKLIPAIVVDVLGKRCSVKLGGSGNIIHNLPFVGPAPVAGDAVRVNFLGRKPTVEIASQTAQNYSTTTNSLVATKQSIPAPLETPPQSNHHNDLAGLEGGLEVADGVTAEYYHLTEDHYTKLTNVPFGSLIYGDRLNIVGTTNIATGKTITTANADFASKTNIIDGDIATYCSGPTQYDFQYFQIDLGAIEIIKALTLVHDSNNIALSYSENGSTWTSINQIPPVSGTIYVFPYSISARYLKITTSNYPSPSGWKVYEFSVFTEISYEYTYSYLIPTEDGLYLTVQNSIPAWAALPLPTIPEGEDLQVGATSGVYPTTSKIILGYGIAIREIYDTCFALSLYETSGNVLIAGWDDGYNHLHFKFGDIEAEDHGYVLEIDETGAQLNCSLSTFGRKSASIIVTENYDVTIYDEIILCDSSSPITVTILDGIGSKQNLTIKNIGSGQVTCSRAGNTIDNQVEQFLDKFDSISIIDYAISKWSILSLYRAYYSS